MTNATDDLIKQLAQDAKPVQKVCYVRTSIEWVVMVALNIVLVSQFYGLRPDMHLQMADPLYMTELALNAVLIVLMGCLASACAFPGRARNNILIAVMGVCFLAYSSLLVYVAFADFTSLDEAFHDLHMGWHCTGCLASYAVLPAIYVSWRLRKLASTQPVFAGFSVLMLAGLSGTLGVRLVMPESNSPELLLFHYFPLLLLCLLGLALGKKLFRW